MCNYAQLKSFVVSNPFWSAKCKRIYVHIYVYVYVGIYMSIFMQISIYYNQFQSYKIFKRNIVKFCIPQLLKLLHCAMIQANNRQVARLYSLKKLNVFGIWCSYGCCFTKRTDGFGSASYSIPLQFLSPKTLRRRFQTFYSSKFWYASSSSHK